MEGAVAEESAASVKKSRTMGETFDDVFPQYLAMGMTYAQFWEQDCALVIPYRKAFQIRQEHENRLAWLQGMYIYEALCDVSPVLHAFAKSGTTVRPYPDRPYEFQTKQRKASAVETEQANIDKVSNYMNDLASRFRHFANKDKDPDKKEVTGHA